MRPPEFTGGNDWPRVEGTEDDMVASMRPPEFTGGNPEVTAEQRKNVLTLQ